MNYYGIRIQQLSNMRLLWLFLLAGIALSQAKTVERFTTSNRQVYVYWNYCDNCTCGYYYVVAYEYETQNSADTTPPFYFYYAHNVYSSCENMYVSDYALIQTSVSGLDISRTGRQAELVVSNITSSANNQISVNLVWSSANSDNINNCNCQNLYIVGIESFNLRYKTNYRYANASGSITVGNDVITVPADATAYIYGYGSKTVVHSH